MIDLSTLSVNFRHICSVYTEIFKKMSNGDLEDSVSKFALDQQNKPVQTLITLFSRTADIILVLS